MIRWFGYTCLAIVCGSIIFVAATVAWWASDRKLPVKVLSSTVLTPEVEPCGTFRLVQQIEYFDDSGTHVDRALYDSDAGRKFLMDIDYDHPPQGIGVKWVKTEEAVPCSFVPGPATYRALPSYWRNPLQRYYWPITRPETVLPFKIVKAKEPDADEP